MTPPRRALRERLAEGRAVVAPGAYDPIGARVVQELGFPAVYTGGYMSGAHLAVTEPLMTMTEQVEVARRVAGAVTATRGTAIRCTRPGQSGPTRMPDWEGYTSRTRCTPSGRRITRAWST